MVSGLGAGLQYTFNRINFRPLRVFTLPTSRNESIIALQHSGIAKYQINDHLAFEFKTALNTGSIRLYRNTFDTRIYDEKEIVKDEAFGFGDLWFFRIGVKGRI